MHNATGVIDGRSRGLQHHGIQHHAEGTRPNFGDSGTEFPLVERCLNNQAAHALLSDSGALVSCITSGSEIGGVTEKWEWVVGKPAAPAAPVDYWSAS